MDSGSNHQQATRLERNQRGTSQSGMRAFNERLVLSLVRRHGALSKTDIARMTSLSAQTVSVIMRQLEADGLLLRGDPIRGKVGQPSVPMSLAPEGALFFGLKNGRRSADLVLVDFVGNVLEQRRKTYNYPSPVTVVEFAQTSIADIMSGLSPDLKSRIAGLGIATPFRLWSWAETIGAPDGVMDAWRTSDIRADIASRYDFPVYLQNDATAACGAELVFGEVQSLADFLYFYIGTFIGGGVVLNGSLYTGHTGNAGALGPMPVRDSSGTTRQLIDVASIVTLEQALEKNGQDSHSLWENPDDWNPDPQILSKWIDDTAGGLAQAIVAAASVIDFEAVLIDGWIPAAVRRSIVDATRKGLAELNLVGIDVPDISEGTVGPNARALGGASLPLSDRFLLDRNAVLQGLG